MVVGFVWVGMARSQPTDGEIEAGSEVTVAFTSQAGLGAGERRQMTGVEVRQRMGELVYLRPPYDDADDLELVLDGDGCLWAREQGCPGTDGLFGTNARLED